MIILALIINDGFFSFSYEVIIRKCTKQQEFPIENRKTRHLTAKRVFVMERGKSWVISRGPRVVIHKM